MEGKVTKKVTGRLCGRRNNLKLENFNLKKENICNCYHLVTFFVTDDIVGTKVYNKCCYIVTASK